MFERFPLALNVTFFAAAAMLVWWAGARLARYADAIANKTGLGNEVLGMVLLGGVTSSPELAVAATSLWRGMPVLTVNDVLGSAAVNVVILAVADFAIGRDALTSVQGSAGVMLQGVLGIILMAVPVSVAVVGDVLVLGMGLSSWLMFAIYLVALRLITSSKGAQKWKPASSSERWNETSHAEPEHASASLRRLIVKTAVVSVAICGAGFVLTMSGEAVAEQSGLGTGFFAVIFLAAATSLPEVSTVIEAVRLKRYEMAISDVFGTNLVNVVIVGVVDAFHGGGPVLSEVGKSAGIGALLSLILTAIFLVGMLERRDRTVFRMGVDSLAVLAVYAAGVVILYLQD
jgi:cation:H+ antiporter